ncbi:MAG: PKD domain-containing protein [Thermoplasmatota archaeon]
MARKLARGKGRGIAVVLAVFLTVLAGCLSNVTDLRQALGTPQTIGASSDAGQDGSGTIGTQGVGASNLPIVAFTVSDSGGNVLATATSSIAKASPAGASLQFDAGPSRAADPNQTLTAFMWDFGDGTTMLGATPSHVFNASGGAFSVTLTITDSGGRSASRTDIVPVLPLPINVSSNQSGTVQVGDANNDLAPLASQGLDRADLKLTVASNLSGSSVTHIVTHLTLVPQGASGVQFEMRVLNGSKVLADALTPSSGQPARITLQALSAGAYVVEIILRQGADATFSLLTESTYQPVNPSVAMYESKGGG